MAYPNITSAQYSKGANNTENVSITAIIDGTKMFVPLDPDNSDYSEILRQVDAGTLTIQEAD